MPIRRFWHRILAGSEPALVESEQPVRITEALEDSTTYVAEFTGANINVAPMIGQAVTIDQIRLDTVGGILEMFRQFTGIVSGHRATGFPHEQSVSCVGRLARLRKRRQGTDLDLTGKTDITAVRDLLTACGISYTAEDIQGWGYPLGQIKPVYWRVGQQAIEVVAELDRVFGCATLEIGDGRVIRFPYSKVPADYADGLYGGHNVQWRFVAGQGNVFFYNDERSRGNVEDIQNFWIVEGLRWVDEDRCERRILAEASAPHPVYGEGFTAGPETFSSEFIQTEALAKAIAIRLMKWHNRIPDTVRIETANIARITPGDLISVFDPAQSLDLEPEKIYVVTHVNREGDFMTIEAVGGPAGATGTVSSKIEVCCGTQREDGTCTNEGTNPSPASPPNPTVPSNVPRGQCDPLEDATCIPGEDYPLIDPPNIFDPVINCTKAGTLRDDCAEGPPGLDSCEPGGTTLVSWTGGDPPPNACVRPGWRERTFQHLFDNGVLVQCKVLANWRHFGGSGHIYRVSDGGAVDALGKWGTGHAEWVMSTELDHTQQNMGNDVIFGSPLIATVSGTIFLLKYGSLVQIKFEPGLSSITFYAEPGLEIQPIDAPPQVFGIWMNAHFVAANIIGTCPPNTSRGALCRNNGGYLGSPGLGSVDFTVTFDASQTRGWGRAVVSSGMGSGYITAHDYINPENPLPGEPTTNNNPCEDVHPDGHRLVIRLGGSDDSMSPQDPAAFITGLVVGYQTCEPNPNYLTVPSDLA